MDTHLYLQQQIEQTHPPFPPSPLPVFSIPFPPPTPPWAQGQPCPPGSLYGSGPPTKTPGGGLGRGLAEVGWGVFLFTFCCPRSLGWGAGEAGTGAVRGREAHSPRAPASPTSLPLPQLSQCSAALAADPGAAPPPVAPRLGPGKPGRRTGTPSHRAGVPGGCRADEKGPGGGAARPGATARDTGGLWSVQGSGGEAEAAALHADLQAVGRLAAGVQDAAVQVAGQVAVGTLAGAAAAAAEA